MKLHWSLTLAVGLLMVGAAYAQEQPVPAKDPDALFHSTDPKLDANKQVVYHIIKDLLEAGHWDSAEKYLTARYIQQNPNLPSGRDGLVKMMSQFQKPQPIPEKMRSKIISVTAEGDLVVVATVLEYPDPKNPGKTYKTTGFDMWRIKDGKADEHWDAATIGGPRPAMPGAAPGAPPKQ